MKTPVRRHLATVAALTLFAALPTPACGPDWSPPVYVSTREPDDLARFAAGDLGILLTAYRTPFLVVAWRRLSGLPLPAETAAAIAPPPAQDSADWEASRAWTAARKTAAPGPEAPPIETVRSLETRQRDDGGHEWTESTPFLNCPADAFRTAIATLADRTARLGAGSPALWSWVRAQDAVFSACGDGPKALPPAEPEADLPALARADRLYQVASAHFYAGRFDEARSRFQAIARDDRSPWSGVAPYLAARALVRKASLGTGDAERSLFATADRDLETLLADRKRSAWHAAARRLRGWIAIRSRPAERFTELGEALARRDLDGASLAQDLIDYSYLLSRGGGSASPAPGTLTDWLTTLTAGTPEAFDHALAAWRASESPAWLVAAFTLAPDGSAPPNDLLAAAAALPAKAAARPSADFHRARLLVAGGRPAEARRILDALLVEPSSVSEENLVRTLRLRTATAASDLIADGVQRRLANGPWDDDAESERYVIGDAAHWLNRRLPLGQLSRVVESAAPGKIRDRLARSVWTRAVLLGDGAVAERAAQALGATDPALASWLAAPSAARPAAATFALARNPGLSPVVEGGFTRWAEVDETDSFRRNWWCAAPDGWSFQEDAPLPLPPLESAPSFLATEEKLAAEREVSRLADLGDGYDLVARRVLAWADAQPDDPRVPEALHRIVVGARVVNCRSTSPNRSRLAFERLKKRYPNDPWAVKTKYWY